jgi:hypothetical protein
MSQPSGSLNPDLDGQPCCVAMCFDVADTVGVLGIRLPVEIGVPPHLAVQTHELPLCAEHGHLLRMGGEIVHVDIDM